MMHGMMISAATQIVVWVASATRHHFEAARLRRKERRMASALSALDDSTLKDLGLYRSEIPSIAQARAASLCEA
ncbi:DUF1127 domain-containing protein [Belnapia sp. T18]|uniref:DUF1127 domain-containing protein n=1 Tax=Belnapia arida TaxID=2804533 RepID=A0ABS1UE70_9PROT|nr:DUF1127 domain-containing protein [Belnapia arida]MBL6081997.1 DUF1127 domain-containing protein [Belnapia arida]